MIGPQEEACVIMVVCVCCARWEKVDGEKVEGGRGDENETQTKF